MVVTDSNTKFVDKAGIDHAIDELKKLIEDSQSGDVDLSDYVTQEQLQAALDSLDINIDLSAYATKAELQQAISNIDLSGYATTAYVDNKVANITSGGETDLSNYYTKAETYNKKEVNNLIPTVTNGTDGQDGQDGFSPIATVSKSGNTATITITDKNGTTTASISDGKDGTSGGSSGGSSGGITYAFDTEIATGETWVDGKPIYMRVINLTDIKPSSVTGYNLYMLVYKDWVINEVIDSRIAFRNGASNYTTENPYQGQITSTSNITTLINNINSYIITRGIYHNVITSQEQTTIQVFTGTYYKDATKKIYLTVKYTKP